MVSSKGFKMSEGIVVQAMQLVHSANKSIFNVAPTVCKMGNFLVGSVSVNGVKSYSSIISNASKVLKSSKSSEVLDATVSKNSLAVKVTDSSVSVYSVEVLNSSDLFVVSIPVDGI
jgi:hypothetical protein